MSKFVEIFKQLTEIKSRRKSESRYSELLSRIRDLQLAFARHDPKHEETLRYFPVAIVACMEGYFRMAIKDLIDTGDPYLGNSEKILKDIKFDLYAIRALHGKEITIGEIASHSVSISRLDHIEMHMNQITGENFLEEIKKSTNKNLYRATEGDPELILKDPGAVIQYVKKTFDMRHIICHELGSTQEFNYSNISTLFDSCITFLMASEVFISEKIYPNAPYTQLELNQDAAQTLADAENKLSSLIEEMAAGEFLSDDYRDALKNINGKYLDFAEEWVRFQIGDREGGGSMWPMQYNHLLEMLIQEWIAQLDRYKNLEEGSY